MFINGFNVDEIKEVLKKLGKSEQYAVTEIDSILGMKYFCYIEPVALIKAMDDIGLKVIRITKEDKKSYAVFLEKKL